MRNWFQQFKNFKAKEKLRIAYSKCNNLVTVYFLNIGNINDY